MSSIVLFAIVLPRLVALAAKPFDIVPGNVKSFTGGKVTKMNVILLPLYMIVKMRVIPI
jgi:hypothetical protein